MGAICICLYVSQYSSGGASPRRSPVVYLIIYYCPLARDPANHTTDVSDVALIFSLAGLPAMRGNLSDQTYTARRRGGT